MNCNYTGPAKRLVDKDAVELLRDLCPWIVPDNGIQHDFDAF